MTLEKLDRAINELMEKFDLNETTEAENQFLRNLAVDLIELLNLDTTQLTKKS